MHTALTVAGSDSCGATGIQADIKTMTANGVYAMSAVTELRAQNTEGISDTVNVTPEFLELQMDTVITDIFPDAVKIGMVTSPELISLISDTIIKYDLQKHNVVVDPVIFGSRGEKLVSDEAIETMKRELFPVATLITPNIPEAELLSGIKITSDDDMIEAAIIIHREFCVSVLIKGGRGLGEANDLLLHGGGFKWFYGSRIEAPDTLGKGCTFSSAIASNLAKHYDIDTAVEMAKNYVSGALAAKTELGGGCSPLNHAFAIEGKY